MPVVLLLLVAFVEFVISIGIWLSSRNSKDVAQKAFVFMSTFLLLWTLTVTALLYVDTEASPLNIVYFNIANVLGYTLGACILASMYMFSLYFPSSETIQKPNQYMWILYITTILITPLSFISGRFSFDGKDLVYRAGKYSLVIVIVALVTLFSIVHRNILLYRSSRDAKIRKQLLSLIIGLCLSILHAIVFLIILPRYVRNPSEVLYAVGYLAPYYFMTAVVFSLLRYRLFDVRATVVRLLAYGFTVSILALAYAVIAFGVGSIFINSDTSIINQRIFYIVLAVVPSVVFQPLKRFFDKLTNSLFYKDAYESQKVIAGLNEAIVSTIDLTTMLERSAKVIIESIKPEYCVFGLRETDSSKQRIIGDTKRKFSNEDINFARKITPKLQNKVVVADYLEEDNRELQAKMRKNDVSVLVRLTTDVDREGVGYIVLGMKKSGSAYNSQDIQVLETIGNALVIAIDNALRFEEIEKFNVSLKEEVEKATKRLRRANDKLITLDQTKDDFISMASHQLRTPLTSVKGYMSMVLEGDAGELNKNQKELLNQAFVSSQRMVYLISDLLNLSRLKTGKFVIEPTPIDMAKVVESEVAQLAETAKARGLNLIYNKPKNFPTLMLDETKIRQVLTNYIDNAIYYTPKGGDITVSLRDGKESIELTVTDSGIGVPKDVQKNLFSKFFRAGNAKKARPDGTGLGLFMAKKVIIAQGGAIIFRSAEGKGSTFGFTINKSKLPLPKK